MLNLINQFSFTLAPIFYQIVYMSVIASIVGLIILLVRKLFKKVISPKWMMALWLLCIFSLVFPISIQSKISIFSQDNLVGKIPSTSFRQKYDDIKYETKLYGQQDNLDNTKLQSLMKQQEITRIQSFIIDVVLPYLWLGIYCILLMWYLVRYLRFKNSLKNIKVNPTYFDEILRECKEKLNIHANIFLIQTDKITSPAIFEDTILIPSNMEQYSKQQITYIFLHELSHYKRKDGIANHVVNVLKSIYFFNPILYFLMKELGKDRELACDEMALLYVEDKKEYCKTLLFFSVNEKNSMIVSVLGINNDKENLERRIDMVKISEIFSKHKYSIPVITLVIILAIVGIVMAKPYNKQIPDITISGSNHSIIPSILGYQWEEKIKQSPATFTYDTISGIGYLGEKMTIKSSHGKIISIKLAQKSGQETKDITVENTSFVLPNNIGSYEYYMEIIYENKSKVICGLEMQVIPDIQSLKNLQNTYLGNASHVGKILKSLPYSYDLSNGMELKTSEKPYGITLSYPSLTKEQLEYNTNVLFTLIPNLDQIQYHTKQGEIKIMRKEQEKIANLTLDCLSYYSVGTKDKTLLLYQAMIKHLMETDSGLNTNAQFLSLDMKKFQKIELNNSLSALSKEQTDWIIKEAKKYHKTIKDASMEQLKEQGFFNSEKHELAGVLISIDEIKKLENGKLEITASKYRGGLGAIFPTYECEYKNGKWEITVLRMVVA